MEEKLFEFMTEMYADITSKLDKIDTSLPFSRNLVAQHD